MPLAGDSPGRSIESSGDFAISEKERGMVYSSHTEPGVGVTPKRGIIRRIFSIPFFASSESKRNGSSKTGIRYISQKSHYSPSKSTPGRCRVNRLRIIPLGGHVRVHSTDDWVIPKSFNPNLSTRDNYALKEKVFLGSYADIRETRDFEYHGNYDCKRQLFQDKLISDIVQAAVPKDIPWIIFTAGAMGAGKSHVVQWMSKQDHFPLPDIVQIDPDAFKMSLPEWDRYVEHAPYRAGRNTRLESGYMVEMAQEAAMQMGKNVWVDGSFRDVDWYQHVFEEIRENHSNYLIAVLYVYASTETCLKRCAMREKITGRHVPEAEVLDSVRRVPKAVELMTPYTDFVAHIKNDPDPTLISFYDSTGPHRNGKDSGWKEIKKRFNTLENLSCPEHYSDLVQHLTNNDGVLLFSKKSCSFAKKAKEFLLNFGILFRVVELDKGAKGVAMQVELSHISGSHRLPQLFIGGKYYGGWEEMQQLYIENKFHDLVAPYLLDACRIEEEKFLRKNSI